MIMYMILCVVPEPLQNCNNLNRKCVINDINIDTLEMY